MEMQQKYAENRNDHGAAVSAQDFSSKTMSVKGQKLTDSWWDTLGIYESVEILILDENKFTALPRNKLKECFPNLKILSAKKNQIEKLTTDALAHPSLEVADFEDNRALVALVHSRKGAARDENQEEQRHSEGSLALLNLEGSSIAAVDSEFFYTFYGITSLKIDAENLCGGCGFEFLQNLVNLRSLKVTGVCSSSCSKCRPEKNVVTFDKYYGNSIYSIVCKSTSLVELDLSGKNMSIDYFMFLNPLPNLVSLRMQGRLVRDMNLRDWPGILHTLKHLSLGVIDGPEDAELQKLYSESTFYAEKILEATNLETLSFDSETNRRIKFSLGTRKVVFPFLKHLTIRNCDLRPLTFFNKENAPMLESLEIVSSSFTEGYFYTIKKRLGSRLKMLRIGIEKMDAPQAIYDLFTFIRSHQDLETLHLDVCETITESQSFYKYFSDRPGLKELYVMGRMTTHRMKRFLYQLGYSTQLRTLLLDIEDPSVVLSYFQPVKNLVFFSLKSTHAMPGMGPPLHVDREDVAKIGEMKSLVTLDLAGCGLQEFPGEVFAELKSLKHLYLNDNNLLYLPEGFADELASKPETPMYVDISCNPINRRQVEASLINGCWLGRSGYILY